MGHSYDDYKTQALNLVKDDKNRLDATTDVKPSLAASARWYSNYDSRPLTVDLTSDGTGDFTVTGQNGLTNFEDGFSEIDSIEWPIASAGARRSFLKPTDYELIRTPTGLVIRTFKTIAANDKIRVTHNARHVLDGQTNTLPDAAFDAVTEYAAGGLCDILSNKATPTTDKAPQVGDLGGFRDLSDKYASRANAHRKRAGELLTNFIFT